VGRLSLTTDHRMVWAKPALPEPTGLSPCVPHHVVWLFAAISHLCSFRPRMPWMVSAWRHPTSMATRSAVLPSCARERGTSSLSCDGAKYCRPTSYHRRRGHAHCPGSASSWVLIPCGLPNQRSNSYHSCVSPLHRHLSTFYQGRFGRKEASMTAQQAGGWSRRVFLRNLILAGAAGVVGMYPRPIAAIEAHQTRGPPNIPSALGVCPHRHETCPNCCNYSYETT
jgi:hypothetical protein